MEEILRWSDTLIFTDSIDSSLGASCCIGLYSITKLVECRWTNRAFATFLPTGWTGESATESTDKRNAIQQQKNPMKSSFTLSNPRVPYKKCKGASIDDYVRCPVGQDAHDRGVGVGTEHFPRRNSYVSLAK